MNYCLRRSIKLKASRIGAINISNMLLQKAPMILSIVPSLFLQILVAGNITVNGALTSEPLATAITVQEQEPSAGLALSSSGAKKLIAKAFQGKANERADARATLLATRDEDLKHIANALAKGVFVPDSAHKKLAGKEISIDVDIVDGAQATGEFILQIPKKYKGSKPFPLLFRFHGSGDTGKEFAEWSHSSIFEDYLTVIPTVPTEKRMSWSADGGKQLFDAIYRHMLNNFNVDTDRVYLSGYSAGGAAAFFLAQYYPHRTAAIVARGRLWWKHNEAKEASMNILDYVPGYFLSGLDDKEDRVEGFRTAEAYYDQHGMPGEFRFVKSRGHEYMPEFTKEAFRYVSKKKRVLYPHAFDGYLISYKGEDASRLALSEQYWLRGLNYKYLGTPFRVEVDGNTITIQGEDLYHAQLFLNDEIVNMDEPVRVLLNGAVKFEGIVPRSAEFILNWFEQNRDPNRLFWNQIEVKQ
ncbi:MAG: putative esterase [Planctomycetota bacterium]